MGRVVTCSWWWLHSFPALRIITDYVVNLLSCVLMRKLVTILLHKMQKKETKKHFTSAVSVIFREVALAVSHVRPQVCGMAAHTKRP